MAYYGEPDGTSFGGMAAAAQAVDRSDPSMPSWFTEGQDAAQARQDAADALYGTGVGGDGSLAHLSEISNVLNGGGGGAGGGGGSTIAFDPSVDVGGGGPLTQAVAEAQAAQQQQENAYTVGMANLSRAMSGNNGRGNVIDKGSNWDKAVEDYDKNMAELKAKQDEKGVGNWLANLFTNQVGKYDKDGNFTIGRQASLGKIGTAVAGAILSGFGVIPTAMMAGTARSMFGQKDGKPNIQFEGYNTPSFWGNGGGNGDGDVATQDNPNISAADGGFDPNPPSNSELQLILDQMSGGGDGADDGDSLMDSVVEATAEKQHRRLNTPTLEQMLNYGRNSAPEFRFFD